VTRPPEVDVGTRLTSRNSGAGVGWLLWVSGTHTGVPLTHNDATATPERRASEVLRAAHFRVSQPSVPGFTG
jgi:hypothetical protein